MKNLLIALAFGMALPAFANEELGLNLNSDEEITAEQAVEDSDIELRPGPGNGPGHGPGNGPGYGEPGDRPGDRPGYGPGWGRRQVVCVAANRLQQRFQGVDRNRQQASREALRACINRSGRFLARTCRLVRCESRGPRSFPIGR